MSAPGVVFLDCVEVTVNRMNRKTQPREESHMDAQAAHDTQDNPPRRFRPIVLLDARVNSDSQKRNQLKKIKPDRFSKKHSPKSSKPYRPPATDVCSKNGTITRLVSSNAIPSLKPRPAQRPLPARLNRLARKESSRVNRAIEAALPEISQEELPF